LQDTLSSYIMPDSPDNATRQHDTASHPGLSRCVEKLVNPHRWVRPLGVAQVDNPEVISEDLAVLVTKRAFKLYVVAVQEDGDEEEMAYECQAGLLRETTGENTIVRPVTAKHNIATPIVEEVREVFQSATLRIPTAAPATPRAVRLHFAEGGCSYRDDEIDIAWGNPVRNNLLLAPVRSFQKVRANFQCSAGQKIGMVIYSEIGATPEAADAPVGFTPEQVSRIYGGPNQITILTGEITTVGADYIAYDINSYGGCLGAVIFLLDRDQPESVIPEDYGKALAVHSGPHPHMAAARNIGFLL
jgi:hypothetical protein